MLNKELTKQKKSRNKEWSTNRLIELGIPFESKNNGNHLMILDDSCMNTIAHFWPSTGKYKVLGEPDYGRGIKHLLKEIGR